MRALDKLRQAKEFLANSEIDDADREAESIIAYCLGIDRLGLYKDNLDMQDDTVFEIDELLGRRAQREPLQYILGYSRCSPTDGRPIRKAARRAARAAAGPGEQPLRPAADQCCPRDSNCIRRSDPSSAGRKRVAARNQGRFRGPTPRGRGR